MNSRNHFEFDKWTIEKASELLSPQSVDCGDSDLNEYFHSQCALFQKALMTQSYVFYETADPLPIVWGAVDFCNDALPKEAIPGNSRRKIPHLKRGFETFPAVKITRLGIQRKQQKCGIGTALLTVIKHFFLEDNRTGCRFITVDAYRGAVPFYEKNGFTRTLAPEDEDPDAPTISLFFDLSRIER